MNDSTEHLPDDLVVYYAEQEMLPWELRDCTECYGKKCQLCDHTGTFIRQMGKALNESITTSEQWAAATIALPP
jgi:hypothetical protein